MQAFLEYCTSRSKNKVNTRRNGSPGLELLFQCANFACISETATLENWKRVKFNGRFLHLCSHECYRDWLDMPSTLGSWSPIQTTGDLNDPPEMRL